MSHSSESSWDFGPFDALRPTMPPTMIERPQLLITDDDRDFRETLQDLFRGRGYQTLLAANGEEAVRIVNEQEVHVVLMDFQMPRLTGIETVRRMRAQNDRLPCILISGAVNDEVLAQAEEVAIFHVLQKPVSISEIRGSVRDALRQVYGWTA